MMEYISIMTSISSKLDFRLNCAEKSELDSTWDTAQFDPGWRYISYARLYFPLEGEGTIDCGGTVYKLTRGKMVLICPSALIKVKCPERLVKYWIHFNVYIHNTGVDLFGYRQMVIELPVEEAMYPIYCGLYERLCSLCMIPESLSSIDELEINSILGMLLAPFLRVLPENENETESFRFLELAAYMYKNMGKHLTLEELGRVAGLHPNYLSTVFRQYTGLSPMAFLNRLRVQYAASELHRNELRINEIASNIGIEQPEVFSHFFKRMVGISPKQFRDCHLRL